MKKFNEKRKNLSATIHDHMFKLFHFGNLLIVGQKRNLKHFCRVLRPSSLTFKHSGNPVATCKLATLPATVLVNINKDVKRSNEANYKFVCIQSLYNIELPFKLL